ncbi:MAG: hypothetical protein ACOC1K_01525 [Nanoarchaeota archaeon]
MFIGALNRALEEIQNSISMYRVGAVIFKGRRILSSGHNEHRPYSSISLKYRNLNTTHAEQSAIFSIKDWSKIKGCSILIIRANSSGRLSLGYPCPMCQEVINHVGINKVYFSNRKGEISFVRTQELNPKMYGRIK